MRVEPRILLSEDMYFSKRKFPKFLTAFFLCFPALGVDLGFTAVLKRKYRLLVQRVTRFLSIFVMVIMSVNVAYMYLDIWCWYTTIKNNAFVLILITTKYKLYHLIYDINGICDLTTKQINVLNIMTILYIFILFTIKITLLSIKCIIEEQPHCAKFFSTTHYVVYVGIGFSVDVIVVALYTITYYMKCSVNVIKVLLRKPNRKLDVFEKSYMSIADCYDKIRPLYDWMIILHVFINVPKLMTNVWTCVLFFKYNGTWLSYISELVFGLHMTLQICLPAIMVELLNSEIDATTQLLNQEITEEKDGRNIDDLRRILRYIERRPLRHLVGRFMPIDLRLLLTLFSLCTTYFIVALQFSQIF